MSKQKPVREVHMPEKRPRTWRVGCPVCMGDHSGDWGTCPSCTDGTVEVIPVSILEGLVEEFQKRADKTVWGNWLQGRSANLEAAKLVRSTIEATKEASHD